MTVNMETCTHVKTGWKSKSNTKFWRFSNKLMRIILGMIAFLIFRVSCFFEMAIFAFQDWNHCTCIRCMNIFLKVEITLISGKSNISYMFTLVINCFKSLYGIWKRTVYTKHTIATDLNDINGIMLSTYIISFILSEATSGTRSVLPYRNIHTSVFYVILVA